MFPAFLLQALCKLSETIHLWISIEPCIFKSSYNKPSLLSNSSLKIIAKQKVHHTYTYVCTRQANFVSPRSTAITPKAPHTAFDIHR